MTFEEIIKLAQNDARERFGVNGTNPVDDLTNAIQNMDHDATPFWLQDEKKKDQSRSDTSWGPPTPLGSGGSAERNGPFAAGMNIVFGGV